jgi:hypothetical protein
VGNYQSGVFRPYDLIDVLGALNQQSTSISGSVGTLGVFEEADEVMGITDAVTAITAAVSAQGWDNGQNWGNFTWN